MDGLDGAACSYHGATANLQPTSILSMRMSASISRSSASFFNGSRGEIGSWGHRLNSAQVGQGRADHIKTTATGSQHHFDHIRIGQFLSAEPVDGRQCLWGRLAGDEGCGDCVDRGGVQEGLIALLRRQVTVDGGRRSDLLGAGSGNRRGIGLL
jgi:hypothetical protein